MNNASIEQWSVVKLGGKCVLYGKVKDHPRQDHFRPEDMQYTSELKSIDFDKGIAVTRNTRYKLA
jgi:hypothetical protein